MLVDPPPPHRRAVRKCDIGEYVPGSACETWFVPKDDKQDVCGVHSIAKQAEMQRRRNHRKSGSGSV